MPLMEFVTLWYKKFSWTYHKLAKKSIIFTLKFPRYLILDQLVEKTFPEGQKLF